MTVNSRRKGHDWEREVARECRKMWPEAHRGLQGDGARVPDVDGTPYWLECKVGTEAYIKQLGKFVAQAVRDADAADDPRPIRILLKTTPRGGTRVVYVARLRDGRVKYTWAMDPSFASWLVLPSTAR